ncbi:hypothetical protein MSG28_012863 [Choristoneura fumiferana]|uniref:Uncharacterized protein n=1 Tax=Choristoneura fumiferana TaxID=7141 RepID=A0ACC0JIC6_CHOFU|nr:hypothetical protein MSG28_012863 [Choristoneura fumiferana]
MKRIRFTLRSISAWPNHVFEDLPATKLSIISRYGYTSFLGILCCFSIVAQTTYMMKNMGKLGFIDLGQTCLNILMCLVYIQRTSLPIQTGYQAGIKEFASKFHLIYYKNKTDYSAKINKKVTKYCEIAVIVQHVQIYMVSFMYNLAPLYSNFNAGMFSSDKPINSTYVHSVSYVLPFDYNNEIGYIIVCLYNFYVSYNLATLFSGHDHLVCVFVFHIWGHLKIFEHDLNYFPRPSLAVKAKAVPLRYTKQESKEVAKKLKEMIEYYVMIKDNRRTVLILLQIVQQSLALKACNMVPVGIVKASFSYFLMLRTFASK